MGNNTSPITSASRSKASTPLPLPSNNFASLGYTFILLNETGFPIQEITLAVAPEEIQQSETSTSNIVMTAGDAFTDSFGPGLTSITMSGTFGQRPTGNSLFGSNQGKPTSSGQYLVLQLRDMFRKYLDRLNPINTPDAKVNVGTVLQFYNPKDNEFWNIEPVGNWFTLSRSKNSPFLYRYKLSFVCTGRASSTSVFDPQAFRKDVMNVVGTAYDTVASTVTSISSYAGGFASMVNQVGYAYTDFLSNIMTPIVGLQDAVNKYLSNSSTIINYPPAEMESTRAAIQDIYDAYDSQVSLSTDEVPAPYTYTGPYSIPVIDPYADYQLMQLIKGIDAYELNSNSFVKNFTKSDFVNQTTPVNSGLSYIDLNNVKSVAYYTVRGGDTIEGIAQATLGDSKYWRDIAEYNGLAFPYITTAIPKPDRTLGPGDSIAIPSNQGDSAMANVVLGSSTPNAKNPAYALGSDFILSSTNDITLSADGDVSLVSGIPNVQQAMFLKLNVHRGELLLHQYYGLTDLRGYRTTALLAAKASAEFVDTLSSDARVGDIANSKVTINGDILNYSAEVGIKLTNQPIVLEGSLALS